MLTQSLEGFRLYPDRRRARPAPPTKPVPVPSFSDLCALCVSAFSSPNLSPFNPKLLALSTQRLEERNEGSPAEGSTFNRPSLRPVPAVDCKLSAVSLRPSFHNSHRIIFFTYPHPLTPIESYSCKKQGEGVPSASGPLFTRHSCRRTATPVYPSPGRGATPISSYVYFTTSIHQGGSILKRGISIFLATPTEHESRHTGHGTLVTTHHSLPATHSLPLKPLLQMAHPYTCTCKKGPAAREPRYSTCAAS